MCMEFVKVLFADSKLVNLYAELFQCVIEWSISDGHFLCGVIIHSGVVFATKTIRPYSGSANPIIQLAAEQETVKPNWVSQIGNKEWCKCI